MAQHTLHPGKSMELKAGDKDEVLNPSEKEGDFEIAFNTHPLIVKHTLKARQCFSFVVAAGGERIINDGPVPLTVATP